MVPYFFLFAVVSGLAASPVQSKYANRVKLWTAAALLIVFAGFRSQEVDRDFTGYKRLYETVPEQRDLVENSGLLLEQDPAFVLITLVLRDVIGADARLLFLTFAALGVGLKTRAMSIMSPYAMVSMLVFMGSQFLLHEMTQIRAGVACGFLLLAMSAVAQRKAMRFFGLVLCASAFHYSAFIATPLYFVNSRHVRTGLWTGLLIGPMALQFSGLSLSRSLEVLGTLPVLARYSIYAEAFRDLPELRPSMLNSVIALAVAVNALALARWRQLSIKSAYFVTLLKANILGVALFFLFYDNTAFAFRFMELFQVAQLVLLPSLVALAGHRAVAMVAMVLIALFTLTYNLYYTQLLTSYGMSWCA